MLHCKALKHKFIPATKLGKKEAEKVLVVLHGLGDSLDGYTFLPDMLQIPGLNYLLVNAPDAYYGGYSWYDYMGEERKGVERSRNLLETVFKELGEQGIAATDIGLFGFSQGCLMSLETALRLAYPIGPVVGISGYLSAANSYPAQLGIAAMQQRFFLSHGRQDPLLPCVSSRLQYSKLQSMGVQIEYHEYDKVHTMLPHELADIKVWMQNQWGE